MYGAAALVPSAHSTTVRTAVLGTVMLRITTQSVSTIKTMRSGRKMAGNAAPII